MLEKWVGGCSGVELLLLITAGDFWVGINVYLPRSKEFDKCQSLSDGALKTVISQVHHSLKTKGDNNKNRKKCFSTIQSIHPTHRSYFCEKHFQAELGAVFRILHENYTCLLWDQRASAALGSALEKG